MSFDRLQIPVANIDPEVKKLLAKLLTHADSQFGVQADPETADDTATLTTAQILARILVGTPTAAADYTTPTGELLAAAVRAAGHPLDVNDFFDLTVINLGATGDTITLVAGATGVSIVGDDVVLAAAEGPSQGTFRFRYTAADTFVVYRVA